MIKVATAECFTHGKIGREIHAIGQEYTGNFGLDYVKDPQGFGRHDLSLVCSLFIPTISAVKTILKVENPPEPEVLIKGIKVYDEKADKEVAKIMAEAVKKQTNSDMAIGTTAGIGRGGIAIVSDDYEIVTTTDVVADLRENDSQQLYLRQEDGIKKTLAILELALNEKFDEIAEMDNVEISFKK